MEKRCVTVSGLPGSGTTTISRALSEKTNLDIYSSGEAFRTVASKMGLTLGELTELSEKESHHPFIHIDYKKVTIILFTHKINGLHDNDFILASKCDIVLKSLK